MKMTIILGLLFVPSLNLVKTNDVYISDKVTDQLLLKQLNEYRKYYKLNPLKWSEEVYKATQHHSNYMVLTQITTHYEEKEVANFHSIYDLRLRLKHYAVTKTMASECVLGGSLVILFNDKKFNSFVRRVWKVDVVKVTPIERMVYQTIWRWHTSEPHRDAIQSNVYDKAAVSVRYTEIEEFEKSIFYQNEKTQQSRCFAVLNLIK